MAKKRANGEGNIRKRKDGRWEARYTAGHDPKQVISYLRGRECHPFYISMCPSTVPLFPML